MLTRGVEKSKILVLELGLWFFPWFDMSESTKKNFSSLAYPECPPLMASYYTKEIPRNTKEKSWNRRFQLFDMSESTKKNFSSLAYLECPPLMAIYYTKKIPKNTKEKSWNRIFQFLAFKLILLTILRIPAAFLGSQQFFWHPYQCINVGMVNAKCQPVIYVINAAGHPRNVKSIGFRAKNELFCFQISSFVFYKIFFVHWEAIKLCEKSKC